MGEEDRNGMDDTGNQGPAEDGAEAGSGVDVDIRTAIDEAVQAVEEAERRREEDDSPGSTDVDAQFGEPAALQEEVKALRDRLMRTLADFDNYRKRVERDQSEDRKYAAAEILREVVGVVDNLERANSAGGSFEDLQQGVEMILRQMADVLKRSGVTRVEALGEPFDPALHEAVSRVEDPEVSEPTVIEEFQPGYTVHDRLLRPTIVRVAVPADGESAGAQPKDEAGAAESTD